MNLSNSRAHLWHPFSQEKTAADPIQIVRGSGAHVYDSDDRAYLDLVSSWWVNMHGHAHPVIAAAIAEQAGTLEHVIFAGFTHPGAIQLADQLCRLLPDPLNRVFFSECGSAAVEIGLKMAIQFWHNQGQQHRNRIIAFQGGYHGDTFGAMSAGRASHFFRPFEELMFSVTHLPFPHTWTGDEEVDAKEAAALEALEMELETRGQETAAIMIEPLVQGAGGMRICRPAFIQAMVEMAHRHQVLVIFDEVMTGFGRTGEMFACQTANATPDIICLAKGLTGGFLPLAVTVASERIYEAFLSNEFDAAFAHGHSYTANPLGCAAALASLGLFESEHTLEKISAIEQTHRTEIENLQQRLPIVRPRVLGDIAAFDVADENPGYQAAVGATLKSKFVENGLIIRPLGNTVYLMPPYCLTPEELADVYHRIEKILVGLI